MESDTRTKWTANANVVSSMMGSSMALLDLEGDQYYSLNGTGAAVWELLETPKTLHDLCGAISEKYDVPVEICRDDITDVLSSLHEAGLVERERHAATA